MVESLEYVKEHLLEIGIQADSRILDFGCGVGNDTIPMAKLLGKKGKVFAIDKEQIKLDQLLSNAQSADVNQRIKRIKQEYNLEVPLEEDSIDFAFLYNVACCIIGQNEFPNFQKIICEIYEVTKKDGCLMIGIKEGKTMLNRIEKAIPLIKDFFILEKKEKGKYYDGKNLRVGLFYHLSKK